MIVTTMNDLPGYRVTEVFGEVFGLTVRSRNIGSDIGASLKGLASPNATARKPVRTTWTGMA